MILDPGETMQMRLRMSQASSIATNLSGVEVLSSDEAHLLPVAVPETWVEESCYQTLQLLEVVHTSLGLGD